MRLSDRLEKIFSHAVALQQSGRLRSTIYCIGRTVFILNQDQTVLIKFRLRKTDKMEFNEPVSFNANDYDSQEIEVRNGNICFIQRAAGFERVKSCQTPDMTPRAVRKLFKRREREPDNSITLHSTMLSLLDESLSHIEFSCVEGGLRIIQRNIYAGSVIEIRAKAEGGLFGAENDMVDFKPIGLRTNDFLALFTFVDSLKFHFLPKGLIMVDSTDTRMPMRALVSKCRYDELGTT